ncbi:MAG: hypothetical protein SFV15_11200 [Polyangiaceae bacterium]|nr:hypothetical protein [Polyangiaceae bacterium]
MHLYRAVGWMGLGCLLSLTACSSSDDSGGGGIGGPQSSSRDNANEALANNDCYLGLQLPGITTSGYGCSGGAQNTSITGLKPSSFDPALRINVELGTPPSLGALDLTKLTVGTPRADASWDTWEAPPGSCTAQAVGTSFDSFFSWDYYRMDFSCAGTANPVDGNTMPPLTLGDFTIVSFFKRQ